MSENSTVSPEKLLWPSTPSCSVWDSDKAYLRVTPLKGGKRLGIKGKLAPRYVGPFPISSPNEEKSPISCSCLKDFQMSMMFSMFLNLNVASKIQSVVLITKLSISRRTWLIRKFRFVSLMKPNEEPEVKPSSSSKSSGSSFRRWSNLGTRRSFTIQVPRFVF